MYYIIETRAQLAKFSDYDFSKCILDVVPNNDHWHLHLSYVCLLYIKPFKSRAGFILPITHTESPGLFYKDVIDLVTEKIDVAYVIDAKRFNYYFKSKKHFYCLKTAYYLKEGTAFSESSYDTAAHKFFYSRHENLEDINTIIPIAKHYEKLETICNVLKKYTEVTKEPYYSLYSKDAVRIFNKIEKAGILVDKDILLQNFSFKNEKASYFDNKVYTSYNIFTITGRPSNSFNGINFAALAKENNSRKAFLPSNDYFVEFDYSSYHLRILCSLIKYSFDDSDIHTHLAKFYFEKEDITKEEYAEGKQLTFKLLYTESAVSELEEIPFFIKVREFKRNLWEQYKKNGYINSFYSGRPLKNIDSITQVLPHILQNYETERNISVLNKILFLLRDKESKLVLYCYDSFLFDYSKKDGKSLLCSITDILEEGGYSTSTKYGKNYNDLKVL